MRRSLMALLIALAISPVLSAQEKENAKPRFGLTFPNIGVIWRITNNIALLPDISLGRNWGTISSSATTSSGLSDSDNDGSSVTVTAGLRFYLRDWKGLSLYLTPRYSYGFTSTDSSFNSSSSLLVNNTSRNRSHAVSGAWGVEYALTSRLSLFGDIGARYSRSNSKVSTQTTTSTTEYISRQKMNYLTTVGTWGLIVYLK